MHVVSLVVVVVLLLLLLFGLHSNFSNLEPICLKVSENVWFSNTKAEFVNQTCIFFRFWVINKNIKNRLNGFIFIIFYPILF